MSKKEKNVESEVEVSVSPEKAKRLAFVEKYKASNPVRFARVKHELDAWVNEVK